MIRSLALVSLLVQASAPSQAPRDGFTLLMGRDTIAVERFTRTSAKLEGELSLRAAGLRIGYVIEYAADGAPSHAVTWAFRGNEGGDPMQKADLVFRGDSVIAEVRPGGTQRFTSPRGSQPYANPSMAMIEQLVRRARSSGQDPATVNLLLLSGGQTLPVTVTRLGADTVVVSLAGVEMRLAADASGRVSGGRIPSQGILVTRFAGAAASLSAPAADYSAPPGSPYTAEEVRVPCPGGFSLAGTLTRPRGAEGATGCVLLLTGSGLQDRDESLPVVHDYKPFRQFAEAFARHGLATLRLDDRGFGASGGDGTKATTADFADDARAALAWLRSRKEIDPSRLAIAGHSEGALIAPMVAAGDPGVRAIVLLAGPAWTGRRIIEYQNRGVIRRGAVLPEASVEAQVRAAMAKVDSLAGESPWLRWFLDHDPLEPLRMVKCPVLVVQGETDRQVDARQSAELVAALKRIGQHRGDAAAPAGHEPPLPARPGRRSRGLRHALGNPHPAAGAGRRRYLAQAIRGSLSGPAVPLRPQATPRTHASTRCAIASPVKPKCFASAGAGADSP